MIVKIKRQHSPADAPYWQSFSYTGPRHVSVSAVLDALNYTDDLYDTEGNVAPRIRWECGCLQTMCGGCAMVINGTPALACNTFLDELAGDTLVLEPLSKFPTVADLIVDRSVIYDHLLHARAYLDGLPVVDPKQHAQQYSVAKCLKCGLCLEVCPNYHPGTAFFGATFANESYLLASQAGQGSAPIVGEYKKHFGAGCSKALSCESVCPMGIETLTSILRMNRK